MSDVALDLRYRVWTKAHGELTFIGTWMRTDDAQYRPVMVIIRTGEEYSEHTVPCIVPMEDAWKWSEELGNPELTARNTVAFVQALRMTPDKHSAIRLTLLIQHHLGDLLGIPPFETQGIAQEVTADLVRIDHDTGEITEKEIRDYV